MRNDLEDGDKVGRIPRKKHLQDDDLLDALGTIDPEEVSEEEDVMEEEDDGMAEEDTY